MRKEIIIISRLTIFIILVVTMSLLPRSSYAHCEIPCGIYADSLRITLIGEHIQTIEKSMKQIRLLSQKDDKNYNQIVRWVINKEEHAKMIQELATQYFMFQRIKISNGPKEKEKNQQLLSLLHQLSVYAMKAKQTIDLGHVDKMNDILKRFAHLYFEEEKTNK